MSEDMTRKKTDSEKAESGNAAPAAGTGGTGAIADSETGGTAVVPAKKDEPRKKPVPAVAPDPVPGSLLVTVKTDDTKPVAGIDVLVVKPDGTTWTKPTDANGKAYWPEVAPTDYEVYLVNPVGYIDVQGHQDATITAGCPTTIDFTVQVAEATLIVSALYESYESSGARSRKPVPSATITLSRNKQTFTSSATASDGTVTFTALQPGLVYVTPKQQVPGPEGMLVSAFAEPVAAQLLPGQTARVTVFYMLELAEIEVGASIQRSDTGAKVPFTQFRASLYAGANVNTTPVRQIDSQGLPILSLINLEPDTYTLKVSPSPQYTGPRLTLIEPPGGGYPLSVSAGETRRAEDIFCFRVAGYKALVRAVDAAADTPLANVGIVLSGGDDTILGPPRLTDNDGLVTFEDLAPGPYNVSLSDRHMLLGGREYVPSPGTPATQSIVIKPGMTEPLVTFRLTEDVHEIFGTVRGAGGVAIPNALVTISDGTTEYTAIADVSGNYRWRAPHAGTFILWVHNQTGPTQRFPVTVNSECQHDLTLVGPLGSPDMYGGFGGGKQGGGGGGGNGEIRESVIDLQSYPLLTEQVPNTGIQTSTTTGGYGYGGGGTSNLGVVVGNALKDVLSWRPKMTDSKSFVSALTQSFALKDVEGHVEYTWTPKSYVVQTDMGAITGAQASIYSRAKVALDQALPLLEGLTPTSSEVLPEDLESMRVIVRTAFTAIVDEFGIEGGPRVPRVDQLFSVLLGEAEVTDPELVGGELDRVRQRFGLARDQVNTVDDEQNLTNFLILVDYINGLRVSWETQKPFFTRNGGGKEPFFGTQLVLLSRALEVVTQSVQEVFFTMDSVFLGAAERGTTELIYAGKTIQIRYLPDNYGTPNPLPQAFTFPANTSSLFVDELLDWALRSAQEGLSFLKDAGKDGVNSYRLTVDQLRKFLRGALIPPQNPADVPPAYRTPRVQRALLELANQTDEAYRLALGLKPPQLLD